MSGAYTTAVPPTIPGDSDITDVQVSEYIKVPMVTVEQGTSVTTAVTANGPSVQIVTFAATLATLTAVSFTLNNTFIGVNRETPALPNVNIQATIVGVTGDVVESNAFPVVSIDAVTAGACVVNIFNMGSGTIASGSFIINVFITSGSTADTA